MRVRETVPTNAQLRAIFGDAIATVLSTAPAEARSYAYWDATEGGARGREERVRVSFRARNECAAAAGSEAAAQRLQLIAERWGRGMLLKNLPLDALGERQQRRKGVTRQLGRPRLANDAVTPAALRMRRMRERKQRSA